MQGKVVPAMLQQQASMQVRVCITCDNDSTWQLQVHDGKCIDRAKGEGVGGGWIGFCLLHADFIIDKEEAAADVGQE